MRLPVKLFASLVLVGALLGGCASQPVPKPATVSKPLPETYVSPQMLKTIDEYYGPVVAYRVERWQNLISNASQYSEQEKLSQVNDFFNGARFVDDIEVWGVEDYWATPLEFLIMDAGDCEDFAMAKYFTLEKMGVDQQQLRLTYCKAATINKAHMVVSYFPSQQSSPLILDNLNMRIRPAVERGDLQPIYSFNGDELWLARKNREDVKAGSVENMRRWQEWRARTETRELPENLVVTTPP